MAELQPKRPQSAYFIWLNSVRASIKEENPDFKVTDIAKKGGEIWRSMEDKDKIEWQAKAAVAKQKYENAVEKFKQNGGEMISRKRKKTTLNVAPAKKSKTVVVELDSD
jgi:cell fate regulator YaaT (PSP1 superfamily)